MTDQAIPAGYLQNAQGHLVPEHQVREHDKLRDSVARDLAGTAIRLNAELKAFKHKALADIADLIAVSAERYGVTLGGKKGNASITRSTVSSRSSVPMPSGSCLPRRFWPPRT